MSSSVRKVSLGRRKFVFAGGAVAGVVLAGVSPGRAYLPPNAIFSAIQLGFSLTSLFGQSGGNGAHNSAELQGNILKQVGEQLTRVRRDVIDVLSGLHEIEKAIAAVPAATVRRSYQVQIGGLAENFADLLRNWRQNVELKDSTYASLQIATRLKDLWKDVERVRGVLFSNTFSDDTDVRIDVLPKLLTFSLVAQCLAIETGLIALDVENQLPPEDVLKRYNDWILDALGPEDSAYNSSDRRFARSESRQKNARYLRFSLHDTRLWYEFRVGMLLSPEKMGSHHTAANLVNQCYETTTDPPPLVPGLKFTRTWRLVRSEEVTFTTEPFDGKIAATIADMKLRGRMPAGPYPFAAYRDDDMLSPFRDWVMDEPVMVIPSIKIGKANHYSDHIGGTPLRIGAPTKDARDDTIMLLQSCSDPDDAASNARAARYYGVPEVYRFEGSWIKYWSVVCDDINKDGLLTLALAAHIDAAYRMLSHIAVMRRQVAERRVP